MEFISRMFTPSKSGKGSASAPTPMPEAPAIDNAGAKAETAQMAKRKTMARSKSVFTSPLGIAGQADVSRKTLLGQ